VVFAGRPLSKDAAGPAPELIVYDMELQELSRLPLPAQMRTGGRLIPAGDGEAVLGVVEQDDKCFLHRCNIKTGTVEKTVEIRASDASQIFRQPADGSFWVIIDRVLHRLTPANLDVQPVANLGTPLGFPCWNGAELYGAHGGELVRYKVD
jgi:hypothetical protein